MRYILVILLLIVLPVEAYPDIRPDRLCPESCDQDRTQRFWECRRGHAAERTNLPLLALRTCMDNCRIEHIDPWHIRQCDKDCAEDYTDQRQMRQNFGFDACMEDSHDSWVRCRERCQGYSY